MPFCQVSIKLIFRNIRLMRCFDSSCYSRSMRVVKGLVLHEFRSVEPLYMYSNRMHNQIT